MNLKFMVYELEQSIVKLSNIANSVSEAPERSVLDECIVSLETILGELKNRLEARSEAPSSYMLPKRYQRETFEEKQ